MEDWVDGSDETELAVLESGLQSVAAHAYNPSTSALETGRSVGFPGQPV